MVRKSYRIKKAGDNAPCDLAESGYPVYEVSYYYGDHKKLWVAYNGAHKRAGIADNGPASWTDAKSIVDAVNRFLGIDGAQMIE